MIFEKNQFSTMKKIFLIFSSILCFFSSFAQVSINPNNIGVGPSTSTPIPLHINKNGEQARFQGTWPYITFYDGINMNGYLQAINSTFEIGSKNYYDLNLYTGDAPRININGNNGMVTVNQKLIAQNGIKLTGPLQAQGESVGADGMVLVSKGNTTPAWENQKVGFQATFPNGTFTLTHNAYSTPISFVEHWDYDNNFTPSTGIFVAPSSGLYHFDWSFVISLSNGDPAVNQGRCRVALYLGSNPAFGQYYYDFKATMSIPSATISGFKTIKLNQGDSIMFSIYQSNENSRDASIFTNGASGDPIFHAYKIF